LDGQQRQTSLYQAFYGVGDHRYFVRVEPLLAGADFEECIFHVRATHRRAKRYATLEGQAQDLVLPLSVLKDGSGGFLQWSLAVSKQRSTDGHSMEFLTALTEGIGQTWIQRIDDYRFPVVTLSDETTADAVCTIFETLNRTGVRLSAFELLTARFWPKSLSLRTLWTKARAEHPIIETYEVDPYYVLQVVSLVAKEFPACKRSDVLSLGVDQLDEWWERATWGMDKALEILRDDCGVLTPAWIPYETMLIPLAGVLAKLAIPTYVYHGEADHLVPTGASAPLSAVPSVVRRTYPNLRHESHNEPEGPAVIADVVGWLRAAVGPDTAQFGQIGYVACGHNFHVAVFRVAHPAAQVKFAGLPMHKPPEAHTLHAPLN
jgi:hypothetical protein